jgi:putative Holliday junction resolvase
MRGLDLGTKTIGVAVTDELGLTAQPVCTIRRANLSKDLADVRRRIAEYSVERIVLGLPLNMNGSEGPRAEMTRRFGVQLEESSGIPVIYWDERLTTVAAERALLDADVSRQKRKAVIDQVAATLILQGWMDANRPRESDSGDEY